MPGIVFWILPAWVVGSWYSLWWPATVVLMCLVGALLGANVFLFAHELTGKVWIALTVWAAVAFSNPIMSYSYLIFTEMPTGLLLLYAFRRLALGWGSNGPLRLALIGTCIGYIPWMAWRCVPIAAALGLYALVQWWRYRGRWKFTAETAGEISTNHRPLMKNSGTIWTFALLSAPVAVSAVLVAWYNLFLFGKVLPLETVVRAGGW